jgi:AcrR family transcriptional regulator
MEAPPKKRRPGRPKTVDREGTIQRAVETYWREGIDTLSLNELCRRTQISKPALYREFGGADGLMDAALERYETQVVTPLLQALQLPLPFEALLERILIGMTTDRGTPEGCMFTEMRLLRKRLGELTRARLERIETRRLAAFEAWARRAGASGEITADISPEVAADFVDLQLASVLVQMGVGADPERIRTQARLAFQALRPRSEG